MTLEIKRFVAEYLRRLQIAGSVEPNLATLQLLHKKHLLNVPFENLDIMMNRPLDLTIAGLWQKIVVSRRGGVCYELNGLFYHLLKALGYDVSYLSAQVKEDGTPFDHVLIKVQVQSEPWLVDVGFGDNFLLPLRLIPNQVQRDVKGFFRIDHEGSNQYQLQRSTDGADYSRHYTFRLQERNFPEFFDRCLYYQTAPQSSFRQKSICSIEREDGRVSLTDSKLVITTNNQRKEIPVINREDFLHMLQTVFGVSLPQGKSE